MRSAAAIVHLLRGRPDKTSLAPIVGPMPDEVRSSVFKCRCTLCGYCRDLLRIRAGAPDRPAGSAEQTRALRRKVIAENQEALKMLEPYD